MRFASVQHMMDFVAHVLRSEISADYPPQTRIEGEIQQLDSNHPTTEPWQVVTGQRKGRSEPRQIARFDSVGFATEDFSARRYMRDRIFDTDHFITLDLIADPDEPRDLIGMLKRADA